MKCNNCGFISSKPFYRCPYCGQIHKDNKNIFDKSISLNGESTIRVKTIIDIIVFNLFGLSFLLDWYFSFQYGITLWGYILFMGIFTFVTVFSMRKKLFAGIIGFDFYIMLGLLLAWCYYSVPMFQGFVKYIPSFILPGYIILFSFFTALSLIFYKEEKKIRPLWFGFTLVTHLAVAIGLFVIFLVCKANLGNEVVPYAYLAFGSTAETKTTLFQNEEIFIFLSFGLSLLYIFNYCITMAHHIFHQVKGFYGKSRD